MPLKEREWQTLLEPPAASRSSSQAEGRERDTPNQALAHKVTLFAELLLACALAYGVTLFFIWQQTQQQAEQYAAEVVMLEEQLATALPPAALTAGDAPFQLKTVRVLQTTYVRFIYPPDAHAPVWLAAQTIDDEIATLYQRFGLSDKSQAAQVTVLINNPELGPNSAPDPGLVAVVYITQTPDLQADAARVARHIAVMMQIHILRRIEREYAILPQWKAMINQFTVTAWLEQYADPHSASHDIHMSWRHAAQSIPLTATLQSELITDLIRFCQEDAGCGYNARMFDAQRAARPLAEYLIATYGADSVTRLLTAFQSHESWETLAPDVYGLSAAQLEAEWHAYLRATYPLPPTPSP